MKSLEELRVIKEQMRTKIGIRNDADAKVRIVVGMATCGIAAGARPVLTAISEELNKRGIADVAVSQTGCIGICQYEPVVEIFNGDDKVTYVKMTADRAKEVIEKHIKGGNVVTEYTIGEAAK